jgi:hypothetical protein
VETGFTCVGNQPSVCTLICNPTAEICDGLDNDCDGAVDDGVCITTVNLNSDDARKRSCDNWQCDSGTESELTSIQRGYMLTSDDVRYSTSPPNWGNAFFNFNYLEFRFPDIPAGATINSVVLKFEWQRQWNINDARLLISGDNGSTYPTTISLSPLPSSDTDRTETINLMTYGIDTASEVNGLRVRFQAKTSSGWWDTSHDWAQVDVTYTP